MGLCKKSSSDGQRRRKMDDLLAFDRFAEEQGGTYTAQMVCAFLKLTLQGVDYAARTGGLKFVCFGRNRFFGRKSVINYRWSLSRKFKDNPRMTFSPGQVNPPRTPDMLPPDAPGPVAFAPSRRPGDISRQEPDPPPSGGVSTAPAR